MRNAFRAAAILLTVAGTLAPAAATVVCQRRNHTLVLRDACKRREQAIDLAQLGYRGPQGPAGNGVRLVDSTGRQVGNVMAPLGEGSGLLYRAGSRILLSAVNGDGFVPYLEFAHEGAGCTGPRLLRQSPTRLVRYAYVAGNLAYYADDPIGTHTVVSFEGLLDPGGDCTGLGGTMLPNGFCCYAGSSVETDSGPVATFDLTTLGAVPPFHVERGP